MSKITVAIIGCGRIASLLEDDALREKPCTHAGAVAANGECVLVAGCDNSEERRKLFTQKWNVPVYDSVKEMFKAHDPQIVVIATHSDSHFLYCDYASQKGVPVIICEKPLADNLKNAKKIAKLAESRTIIINHERRYSQNYFRAKEILDSGKLGSFIAVRAVLYFGKTRRLIDQLWDDGTHLVDAIMFLTNSILTHKNSWGADLNSREGTAWLEGRILDQRMTRISTNEDKKNNKINSRSFVSFGDKKIPVLIEVGAGRDHLVFEIEFSCEKGKLRIGNDVFDVFESVSSPYAENFRSLSNTGEVFSGLTGYFANMLQDAVSCIKNPKKSPVSGAVDGLRVIEYLDSVGNLK